MIPLASTVAQIVVALILIVAIVVLWIAPSWFVAMYAERKGHPFWGFLVVGLFLSWIIALIVALVVPDRRTSEVPSHSAVEDDALDRLERLTKLRDVGALTSAEFAERKARILADDDI